MKKKIFVLTLAILILLSGELFAANYGSLHRLEKMENTTKKVEANYEGTGWATLIETNSTLDIGGADPGAVVGNFFAGITAPEGTITQLKPTFDGTMTFKGSVLYDGTYYYTSNNPTANNYRTSTSSDHTTWTDYTDISLSIATEITNTDDVTIAVPAAGQIIVRFAFDMSAALLLSDDFGPLQLRPGQPDVTITQVQ